MRLAFNGIAAVALCVFGFTGCDEGSSQSSLGNMGPSQDRDAPTQIRDPGATGTPSPTPTPAP
jgi:hypothetical protein